MQTKQKLNSLIWFTTNLRTRDNEPLTAALKDGGDPIAVYCLNPDWLKPGALGFPKMNRFRLQFLLESLDDLSNQLAALGIPLKICVADPLEALPSLLKEYKVTTVYMQKDWTPEEYNMLLKVKSNCPNDLEWKEYFNQFLVHPKDLPFPLENLPIQFTAFRRKVEKTLVIRPEVSPDFKIVSSSKVKTETPTLESLGYQKPNNDTRSAFPFKGGSNNARQRLSQYFWDTDAIQSYKETRNGLIGTQYSSKLSPWLAMGCISPRTLYFELKRYEVERTKNESTYWLFFELLWRDFFKYVSLKHGKAIFYSTGIQNNPKSWKKNKEEFQKWMDGKTESDFVNANMLELKHTGWMSNRGRQNVASYLTKTLGIDWRWGAAYFESMLIDYDVHSNYGNWMYVAGVGNDPRDRIFNVEKQAEYYDPYGHYRNLWLSKKSIA